ncbi:hypothetical protein HAX54_002313 [Datura stramonium]|uniref:Uncharacterized protein n=1 Tax=Datura stramonium TaxID=4076 RepID=A0ABS8T3Q2_DATST|nr:hypothetical protein [Datura stramonium]
MSPIESIWQNSSTRLVTSAIEGRLSNNVKDFRAQKEYFQSTNDPRADIEEARSLSFQESEEGIMSGNEVRSFRLSFSRLFSCSWQSQSTLFRAFSSTLSAYSIGRRRLSRVTKPLDLEYQSSSSLGNERVETYGDQRWTASQALADGARVVVSSPTKA